MAGDSGAGLGNRFVDIDRSDFFTVSGIRSTLGFFLPGGEDFVVLCQAGEQTFGQMNAIGGGQFQGGRFNVLKGVAIMIRSFGKPDAMLTQAPGRCHNTDHADGR